MCSVMNFNNTFSMNSNSENDIKKEECFSISKSV